MMMMMVVMIRSVVFYATTAAVNSKEKYIWNDDVELYVSFSIDGDVPVLVLQVPSVVVHVHGVDSTTNDGSEDDNDFDQHSHPRHSLPFPIPNSYSFGELEKKSDQK
jgi:hypothetical protein